LSKIFDNHVFCYASPESSTREFWAATQRFQDKPMYSSLDRAQPGGWGQFCSWMDMEVAPMNEFYYHVSEFASFPRLWNYGAASSYGCHASTGEKDYC
jgi:hypothetical protein